MQINGWSSNKKLWIYRTHSEQSAIHENKSEEMIEPNANRIAELRRGDQYVPREPRRIDA
ncbi:hypothetical protein [Variovorax sp. UC122_21]|uniref:hypothetical protein n=1 Tax=Variovorax sp. UC122_21 TaxID=3374554 RepID=UPI0037576091